MRRLDRAGIAAPASWASRVAASFPDYAAFLALAREFERLPVNSGERRAGFIEYAKARGLTVRFKELWGNAKEALARMSAGKCAYCEGEVNARRAGQVEHFKPKALFPLLAYDWDNYFLGCAGCNGAKWDKWPVRGAYLRPDRGAPEKVLRFGKEGGVAALGSAPAAATVRDFDLNRDWLVKLRARHIRLDAVEPLRDLLSIYAEDARRGQRLIERLLARLSLPERVYSVALMQCAGREWNAARRGRSRRQSREPGQ